MSRSDNIVPQPSRRTLRTLFNRPRDLRRFAPQIADADVVANLPAIPEAADWGQVVLLNDVVLALHSDGTASQLSHLMTFLHGERELAQWDTVVREYDRVNSLETIRTAAVHSPGEPPQPARSTTKSSGGNLRRIETEFSPLRPGVVLEFETQFDRFKPFPIAPGLFSQIALQGLSPRQRVRLTVAIAEPFQARYQTHHCDWQPEETEEHGYHVYRWDVRDLPGIPMDRWAPSERTFAPWVDVATLDSWQPVAEYYARELDPRPRAESCLARLTKQLTAAAQTDAEKVQSVYAYASRDVRYGRHPRETMLETPRDFDSVISELRGDCKDKSALMVSMLSELGIPANIALVQTRSSGGVPGLPAPWFDHALVRTTVQGETVWLDAAGGPYTFGDVPYTVQGADALVLGGDDGPRIDVPRADAYWEKIPDATCDEHFIQRECSGRIEPDGTYRLSGRAAAGGEEAVRIRARYLGRSPDQREKQLSEWVAAELLDAEVTSARFVSLDDLTEPVRFEYEIVLPEWGRPIGDVQLLRLPWAEPIQSVGPLSARTRTIPIAGPRVARFRETHCIDLPEGVGGYDLPYETDITCRWGRYRYTIDIQNSQLSCTRNVEYCGGIVQPEQFAEFKQFWADCLRADRTDVVLVKGRRNVAAFDRFDGTTWSINRRSA